MASYGYTLSSEEHRPATLVANASRAEEAGFDIGPDQEGFLGFWEPELRPALDALPA